MRRLTFFYDICLTFSAPVTGHAFLLRCVPPSFPGQQVLDVTLKLDPATPYTRQRDGFGNLTQSGRVDTPHTHFRYTSQGVVLRDDSRARPEPCPPMYRYPSAFTRADGAMAAFLGGLSLPDDPARRAWALLEAVHDRMAYTPGVTAVTTTAAQAFSQGHGVCQDFAHIYLALARQVGLPARYASGLPQGEGASHAWCEVWLDGVWTGVDPTRRRWTDEGYLRFNVGRDFWDCPMERGVFLGLATQEQQVFMRVDQQ